MQIMLLSYKNIFPYRMTCHGTDLDSTGGAELWQSIWATMNPSLRDYCRDGCLSARRLVMATPYPHLRLSMSPSLRDYRSMSLTYGMHSSQ